MVVGWGLFIMEVLEGLNVGEKKKKKKKKS